MNQPSRTVLILNRQRDRPIDRADVQRVVAAVLDAADLGAELGIHFVSARQSALLNQRHLQHAGPTDILTFDHGGAPGQLRGELFICVAEAVRQATEYGTTWQSELLRYVIHGLLHLQGYDDLDPERCRVMKRTENRMVARWVGKGAGNAHRARTPGSTAPRSRDNRSRP